jgi:hypothetical protein
MFMRMVMLAVAVAIGTFAIRYGVPHLLGTDSDVTFFDAAVRALFVLVALIGIGWWGSRQRIG